MSARRTAALRKVVRSVAAPDRGVVTDRELLREFVRENDQSAFEALVTRHTGMVLGVCRRVLPKVQDAEDACQATFLVLARKASAGRWQESVANWLYTTARRVAHNARVAAERRARREESAAVPESVEPVDRMTGRELLAALDAALDGLPARYREPLVLCYLEGLTRDEAAQRLGVPLATLHTRIDRARKRLHEVLTKAGCALGAGLLALAASAPAGALPPRLVQSILATTSGRTPLSVGELAKGIAVSGPLARIKLAVVGAFGLVTIGFTLAAVPAAMEPVNTPANEVAESEPEWNPKSDPPKGAPEPVDPPKKAARDEKRSAVKGVVLGPDDKPVAGAKLFLYTWTKPVVPLGVTGADGAFALTVGASDGAIVATAPGYGLAWQYLDEYPSPAHTLRLTPDEPIRGRVINLEGKPVAGVTVSVVGLSQPPGSDGTLDRWLKSVRDPNAQQIGFQAPPLRDRRFGFAGLLAPVTSDRNGTFEVRGVGRDRIVNLRVTGPTVATHEMSAVTRKVDRLTVPANFTCWWDGTVQGSEPVVVASPVPVTCGRVLDEATGKPVPGTVLHVENLTQLNTVQQGLKATADKDGRFTLPGLPQSALRITVYPPDGAPYHRLSVAVPIDPAERSAFDVKLTRGIPATVKIVDKSTGRPVKAHLRYGVFPDDNHNAKAVPHLWHPYQWTSAPHEPSQESEFQIVVFPGKGLLAAHAGPSDDGVTYVSAVGVEAFAKYRHDDQLYGLVGPGGMWPHQWNTFARIDAPANATELRLTLELDRGVTAAVRLVDGDGKPVVGAESFRLGNPLELGDPLKEAVWARPAAEALFTATALKLGEKRRVMFVHTERKLAGSAVVVGGAKEPLEVRMAPWGAVTGRLVGAGGKPVEGAVYLSLDFVEKPDLQLGAVRFPHPESAGVSTEPDGRFHIHGLVPGLTYRWFAHGPNGVSATVPDMVAKSGKPIDLGDVVLRDEEP